jgi:hypothetical protein
MKQYLLFCVLSFCICMESLSQESDSELIEVVGLVYALNERNSEPLVGANIVAYTSDSTYINSSISDEIGKYSMFVNKIPTITLYERVSEITRNIPIFTSQRHNRISIRL